MERKRIIYIFFFNRAHHSIKEYAVFHYLKKIKAWLTKNIKSGQQDHSNVYVQTHKKRSK